jgi:hypothetical protein
MDITHVGPYEILEELGQGGMGIVYRAHQAALNRIIALKVLPRDLERDADAVRRFREEGITAARLRHEHVVAVYDAHVEEPPYYIAMEFLEGKSAAELLKSQGRFDPATATELAVQLCRALSHAHARGIIHRDVKPANVIISSTGKATLTDFGIARMQDRAQVTMAGQVLGSPNYMSPEQAQGKTADARSDVYGCGAVLFALLTGLAPFPGEDTLAVMYQIVHHDSPPVRDLVPEVSPELETIVAKALARDSESRYQSADDFLHALQPLSAAPDRRAAAGSDSSVTLVGGVAPVSAAAPPRQGRGKLWLGLGLATVVLAGGAAFALHLTLPHVIPKPPPPKKVEAPPARPRESTPPPAAATPKTQPAPAVMAPKPPPDAKVPDLSGRTELEATQTLTALGLALTVSGRSPSQIVAEGRVISQDPKPGGPRNPGEQVSVVLSSGPAKQAPRPAAATKTHRPHHAPHATTHPKSSRAPKAAKKPGKPLLPP